MVPSGLVPQACEEPTLTEVNGPAGGGPCRLAPGPTAQHATDSSLLTAQAAVSATLTEVNVPAGAGVTVV